MSEIAIRNDALALRSRFSDHINVFKPGIVGLVVVSALGGFYIGNTGTVDWSLIFWTLTGLASATAGSAALNNYLDRDIDKLMARTSTRGMASGTVSAAFGLTAGLALTAVSVAVMALMVNTLSALLTASAVFGYVVVYGHIMKRRTSWANQVGGIAGALPPAIGYSAASGTLNTEAFILFAIVAVWQQPHALSLALKYTRDYAAAKIPVIPVACGIDATKKRIFVYTLILVPLSAVPFAMGNAGLLYLATSVIMGLAYVAQAASFTRSRTESSATLFIYSIVYLTTLFTVMVVDLA